MNIEAQWNTGAGYELSFGDILDLIDRHIDDGGKIFIGTDSSLLCDVCIFSIAICLHGAKGQSGGRYFYYKIKEDSSKHSNLAGRMFREVAESVKIGLYIAETRPEAEIELHIDVSMNPIGKTKSLIDHLTGYAKGAGFECKIKPDAWASNAVADKHSKR